MDHVRRFTFDNSDWALLADLQKHLNMDRRNVIIAAIKCLGEIHGFDTSTVVAKTHYAYVRKTPAEKAANRKAAVLKRWGPVEQRQRKAKPLGKRARLRMLRESQARLEARGSVVAIDSASLRHGGSA